MDKVSESLPSNPAAVTPYICVRNAAAAIDFYVRAFDAVETLRLVEPGSGKIGHAEIKIGEAIIMLSDEYPDFGAVAPETVGGSPVKFHVYVDNADRAFQKALDAGATELRPVKDQFFGDRSGLLLDPFGHQWFLASKIEDVSQEEMQSRWSAMME